MQGEIGLGTYNLLGRRCTDVVQEAYDLGYRLFDTASVYENHKAIGKALGDLPRDEVRIVSKIWIEEEVDDRDIAGSVDRACEKALAELGTDYLDVYLIHWPNRARPLEEMLKCMESLKGRGLVREIGVSNFTEHHLQDAYDEGIAIAWNQIEVHPQLSQKRLIEFARSHGTKIMAYRPFGKGKLLKEVPLYGEIGRGHGKTPAQIVLRWLVQQGLTVIPKASSREHLEQNLDVFDFSLSEEEVASLDALNSDYRTCEKDFSEFDY